MRLKMTEDFYKVLHYCAMWKIEVQFLERAFFDWQDLPGWVESSSVGPSCSSYVLYSRTKRVILLKPRITYDFAHEFLHELVHCLVKTLPNEVDEIDTEFLALEYYSSRFLRLQGWSVWMMGAKVTNSTGEDVGWDSVPLQHRSKLLKTSFELAQTAGLLHANGKPTFCNVLQ